LILNLKKKTEEKNAVFTFRLRRIYYKYTHAEVLSIEL